MLAAGIVTISIDLGVSITDVALLSGYQLLVVGASGFGPLRGTAEIVHSSLPQQGNSGRGPYFCSLRSWVLLDVLSESAPQIMTHCLQLESSRGSLRVHSNPSS